jgi:hypothetical protein
VSATPRISFGTFLDWAIAQPDQNLASVCRRWGGRDPLTRKELLNESTLRNYVQEPSRWPSMGVLFGRWFHRMTPAERVMLMRLLGQGLTHTVAIESCTPQVLGVEHAVDATVELHRATTDLQQEVVRATRDGRIDRDEDLRITQKGHGLIERIKGLLGMSQRQALAGGNSGHGQRN